MEKFRYYVVWQQRNILPLSYIIINIDQAIESEIGLEHARREIAARLAVERSDDVVIVDWKRID